ncbi:MAG TPA: NAD-dependent epimerase/dehydratase family protein [Nitrososphaeraceae archaeon]|nr:NAD-dependent epimerase/dehydratase family protein [Nitrososphaeraceae archaeon]
MTQTHVVFGAAGSLGAAIVRRLAALGMPTRSVVRSLDRAKRVLPQQTTIEIEVGDALNPESVHALCRNAKTIYHCVNVPYQQWSEIMPKVTDNILVGAKEAKASVVFPGNVYGYGRFQYIPATEDHPLAATSKKGKLRNAIERKLMDAHKAGDVTVVITRFPDYYGPNVVNRLVAPIFENAISSKKAQWIGKLNVPHDLIYIEDAAAAAVLLAMNEDTHGQVWHIPGAGPLTGRQFIEMAFKAAGNNPDIGVLSGGFLRFASLVNSDAREMMELLYEFEEPLVLDGTKFARAFPSFSYTPHEEAIRQTVEWFRKRSMMPRPKAAAD